MGILDIPVKPYHTVETVTNYGHSYSVVCVGAPTARIQAATAGEYSFTVDSTRKLQVGHRYTLRRNTDYHYPEDVWVIHMEGTTVYVASPLVYTRALNDMCIDQSFIAPNRFMKLAGNPPQYTNRGVGGAVTSKGGDPLAQGGFNAVMQLHPDPPGVYGDPSPGVNTIINGLNDLSTVFIAAVGAPAIIEAARHAYRAMMARFNLAILYQGEVAFPDQAINTTFAGSGSWTAVTNDATQNSGTGYRKNPTSGATITHALPAAPTGITSRIVDFCFVGNYVGDGGAIPASIITFTIDGTEVFPIGGNSSGPYSVTNRFSTKDQNFANNATGVSCVARFLTDGDDHSIVATAGTGGMTLDWLGYEADYCSPCMITNVCVTPGSYGSTTATNTPAYNTMIEEVADEFNSSNIQIADIYSILSPGGVPVDRAWTTVLDPTHPNTYGHGLIGQEMYMAYKRMNFDRFTAANL